MPRARPEFKYIRVMCRDGVERCGAMYVNTLYNYESDACSVRVKIDGTAYAISGIVTRMGEKYYHHPRGKNAWIFEETAK